MNSILTETFKYNIINQFKTNNIIIDVILSSIGVYMLSNIHILKNYIYMLITYKYINNTNESTLIFVSKGEVLTPCYIALLHKITTLKTSRITCKKELVNEVQYNTLKKIENFVPTYVVSQKDWFYIYPDIKCTFYEKQIEKQIKNNEDTVSLKEIKSTSITLSSTVLKLHEIEDFIKLCIEEHKLYVLSLEHKQKHYYLFDRYNRSTETCYYFRFEQNSSKKIEHLAIPELDSIMNGINYFLNNEEEYKNKGYPWKHGLLLHGEPGTGKTSFIKALSNYTNRHIISIPLSRTKTNHELMMAMYRLQIGVLTIPFTKRIIIFEDIDCMCPELVKSRELKDNEPIEKETVKETDNDKKTNSNLSPGKTDDKLTLSFFLNLLDGIVEYHGGMIIMTTNRINFIDPALIRPGRIDTIINLTLCTSNSIKLMLSRFYEIDIQELNYDFPDNKLSPARIEQICKSNKLDMAKAINVILE